jgi:uroporphyrinogen-III synthase
MPPTPLAGLRVLLTRPKSESADDWAMAFAAACAVPVPYPTVAIVPPTSWQDLDEALARLAGYDWMVFTSQTAVASVLERVPGQRFPPAIRAKIAAVGPTTARAIEGGGGVVALLPEDNRQEGLVEAFRSVPAGTRVLFPIADGGRTLLAESLRSRGCVVDVVTAYRTLPKFDLAPPPAFDVATFASPSALRAYLAHAGRESLAGKVVAVIGPSTAKAAAANGILPAVARTPNVDALILAIAQSRTSQGDP